MKKNINHTTTALERVMQDKREWLATANRELDAAIAMENKGNADYWRGQIARTSGAINALKEVAELAISYFEEEEKC